jgi:ABC-type sugar transport system ATPase subunit
VVEPIGSEIILLASCGSDQLTARVDPQTRAKPQMEMDFLLDMSRIHIFDDLTKEAY